MTFSGNFLHFSLGQLICTVVYRSIPSSFRNFSFSRPLILLKRFSNAFSSMASERSFFSPSLPIFSTDHSLFSVTRTLIEHMVVCMNPTGTRRSRRRAFITDDLPLLVVPTNSMTISLEANFSRTFLTSVIALVRLWHSIPKSAHSLNVFSSSLRVSSNCFEISLTFSVSFCSNFVSFSTSSRRISNFPHSPSITGDGLSNTSLSVRYFEWSLHLKTNNRDNV